MAEEFGPCARVTQFNRTLRDTTGADAPPDVREYRREVYAGSPRARLTTTAGISTADFIGVTSNVTAYKAATQHALCGVNLKFVPY